MRIVVTGSNRGLGLEFVRQCLGRGDTVLACCREPHAADELNALARESLTVLPLDVANADSAATLTEAVGGPVDLLVNNAGIYGEEPQTVAAADPERLMRVLRVNVAGPLAVLKALTPHLQAGSKVLNMSSGYGSIANAAGGWPMDYCCSKAALNMLTRIDATELPGPVVCMSPGWVRTDMGGENADLSPEESVRGMLRVMDTVTAAESGTFRRYDGSSVPW